MNNDKTNEQNVSVDASPEKDLNRITASEAGKLTAANQKKISDLYNDIKMMAKRGYRIASWELTKVYSVDECKSILEADGYTVEVDRNIFSVKW